MPSSAPRLTGRSTEHPVPRGMQAEENQFQSERLQKGFSFCWRLKHLGVSKSQGATRDNMQDCFHWRKIRPMLHVIHETIYASSGPGCFLVKDCTLPYFILFFCLKNIISFINNGDGSWWQLFSTS